MLSFVLFRSYSLEAVLNAKAEVNEVSTEPTYDVKEWTIVQRNSQGEINGNTIFQTCNGLCAQTKVLVAEVGICTGAIVEVESLTDNGLLPLVNSIQTEIIAEVCSQTCLDGILPKLHLTSYTLKVTETQTCCPIVVLCTNCQCCNHEGCDSHKLFHNCLCFKNC